MNRAILIAMILTIGILGCSTQGDGAKKDQPTHIVIAQWGQERYLIYLPLYVAQEKGYFSDEGLTVDLKFSGNDDQVFGTVISGDADFGVGDPTFTAISREKGFRGKVVATIVNGVAIWGVTNDTAVHPIHQVSDLAGLRVGTFPSPSTNYALMKHTIETNKQVLGDTKIIQAPIGSQLALLEHGDADIAMELEPSTSLAISQGYRLVFSSPDFYGQFAFTGVTTTEDYIDSHPEIVQSIVTALERAVRFCHDSTESATLIATEIFPSLSPDVTGMAVQRMTAEGTLPQHVLTSNEAWQGALDVRLQVGDLAAPQTTETSVDNRFANQALQQLN